MVDLPKIYKYHITQNVEKRSYVMCQQPASVSYSDARPTSDQEVAGPISAESGNILSWRLIMKHFRRFKKGSCVYMYKYWLNAQRT